MKTLYCLSLLAAMTIASSQASATTTTLDFNTTALGDITGVDFGGVTFRNSRVLNGSPAGGRGLRPLGPDSITYFFADFTVSGVTTVAVTMGDFGTDVDNLFLRAFDSGGNRLGEFTATVFAAPSGVPTTKRVSITTSTEIASVEFFARANSGNSVFADDFAFTVTQSPSAAVPLPAAGWALLAGIGSLRVASRRKAAR